MPVVRIASPRPKAVQRSIQFSLMVIVLMASPSKGQEKTGEGLEKTREGLELTGEDQNLTAKIGYGGTKWV